MRFVALLPVLARVQLIVFRMILLFFPPMTLLALVLVRTTIFVVIDELVGTPIKALILCIDVKLGFPPKILPVVGEHTLVSLMIVLIVGAPDCLKVEHIEVRVQVEFVNKLD